MDEYEYILTSRSTQLSFVPTTVFATGEAPTITVTSPPRTVTQVEVSTVTVEKEACSAPLASSEASASAITITSISRESCEVTPVSTINLAASSGASAELLTITQVLRASDGALFKQATVTEVSTITLGTDIAAYGALEPVTVTQVVTETVSADAAIITDFKNRANEALPAQTITVIPNGIGEIDVCPHSSHSLPTRFGKNC